MIDMSDGYDTFSYVMLVGGILFALAHLVALYAVVTWFWTGNPKLPWPRRTPKPYERFPTPHGSIATDQRAHCIRGRVDVWQNPSRVFTAVDCGCVHCRRDLTVIRPCGVY